MPNVLVVSLLNICGQMLPNAQTRMLMFCTINRQCVLEQYRVSQTFQYRIIINYIMNSIASFWVKDVSTSKGVNSRYIIYVVHFIRDHFLLERAPLKMVGGQENNLGCEGELCALKGGIWKYILEGSR